MLFQEHLNLLQARAVAYINQDTCASGPVMDGRATPSLWNLMKDVTKLVIIFLKVKN